MLDRPFQIIYHLLSLEIQNSRDAFIQIFRELTEGVEGNSHINPQDILRTIYNSQMQRYLPSDGYNISEHTNSVVSHPDLLTLEQEGLWSSLAGILN